MWLRTLGAAEISNDPASAAILATGKPVALLTYLSAASGRTATRSVLRSLLWADLEPDAAKHALRQILWYLPRKLRTEVVSAGSGTVTLLPGVKVDRDALLAASARGDHERVVTLYTGEFVPGFAVPGGAGFEEWAALERRRLLEVFRHAVNLTVAAKITAGRARDAIALAKRLRGYDLYNENGWRLLLDACASAGDLLTAKKEAGALQQLADQDEFELEPATRAAIRLARSASAANGIDHAANLRASATLAASLVGREERFASLLHGWDRARTGAAVRMHVTARPGIGKTRILQDFATRIRALRAKVVMLAGRIGSRDIPYAAAGDLAEGLAMIAGKRSLSVESASTLVALNPSLSTWFERQPRHDDSNDVMRARTLALRELVRSVTFEHSVAILIDDLHWWDEESCTVLGAVADSLKDEKVLLVSTGRPEARRIPMVSGPITQHLPLDPLTAAQVEELFLSIARAPSDAWALTFPGAFWRASRGSPLLALEMLQFLEDRELLRREDGAWVTDRPDALIGELQTSDVLRARLEELDRGDRWLLSLLARAGAPVDVRDLVAAAERPASEVGARLVALDTRGLVVRAERMVSVAHDEIGEEALRLSGPETAARAGARLGVALSSEEDFSEQRARRAAQLLRHGELELQAILARRFAVRRYASGDRRSPRSVVRDLFAGALGATIERALVRRMPWTWRLGLVSSTRRRLVLAGIIGTIGLVAVRSVVKSSLPPPDAQLGLATIDSSGKVMFYQAEIREDAWSPTTPLVASSWTAVPGFELSSGSPFNIAYDPPRGTLYSAEAVEEGTIELQARRGASLPVRLADAPGDDVSPSLSPDGTRLAFASSRWDSLGRYDIAVFSLVDGTVKRLTEGSATDGTPIWSRDGTRLAFARNNWTLRPNEVCTVRSGGDGVACIPLDSARWGKVNGWLDDDRVLYTEASRGAKHLRVMQVSTGERETVVEGVSAWVSVSPDARWVFCVCTRISGRGSEPVVFPVTAPYLARRIVLPRSDASSLRAFWIASRSSATASRIAIERTLDSLPIGIPSQLSAEVLDGRGITLRNHARVRWWVRDTSAARIDSLSGIVTATGRSPRVVVHASVGRSTSDSVVLGSYDPISTIRLDEQWHDDSMPEWIPYGKPEPKVVVSGGRRAFLNNGEGSFTSGAITKRTFDGRKGLTVDLEVSALVTRPQWQNIGVALREGVDTSRARRSLGRNVDPAISGSAPCAVGIHGEDQVADGRIISFESGAASHSTPMSSSWLDGTWHTMRLDLLPDGRCGILLDGRPVAMLPGIGKPGKNFRLNILGNSRDTEMLVGRITIREGTLSPAPSRRSK